ncbi:hypothetical protein BWI93_01070 [Siphonobacter sp. BAB-5385]|uniref:hypothetical protein n=1 Tax=Siphonobacter sp. BAB-5385 TaxID=1864822 RepID=UPI000B9EA01D|nr:hypothetical protein [Siphonobacter sp. BAB-5385]OZI09962.1 hypothetical protein BWI93_01070 [Siphonobacter sp. BAB-5385]
MNNRTQWQEKRLDIGTKICDELSSILQSSKDYIEMSVKNPRSKTKLVNRMLALMNTGTKTQEYSALCSTVILYDCHYLDIKTIFNQENLWDADFQQMEQDLIECCLDIKA